MKIICLDLEGVLIPEIWISLAERTGVDELRRTTRDEPDYDVLMQYRLAILRRERLGIREVQETVATMRPLPGALEFLAKLRALTQLIILSDTFVEFAKPLIKQLGWPTVFCHDLEISDEGMITNYRLRQPDQKRNAVLALQGLNFTIASAGDSYNDLTMLETSDYGFWFRPTDEIKLKHSQFPVAENHEDLYKLLIEKLDV